jgi:hypothetical protein
VARLWVRLTPRAGDDRIDGVDARGELRVRVRAAPADGQANEALLRLLARELGLARRDVAIERGQAARHKLVALVGVSGELLARRWPGFRAG